ncbi:hypothetical protein [Streptomyces sp. NPDC059783]|uniref:hypothetical protein n=1 Tax=Streptomyces sp. NPDC059783 TaxID=3346944 RepID=UPI0036534BBC
MGSNSSHTGASEPDVHGRGLLTDYVRRCTAALAGQDFGDVCVLNILRDQMEAVLREQQGLPVLSWTGHVAHPGTHPGPTVVYLTDSAADKHALHLDDDLREALGLMLIEPPDPDEVAAENADGVEPDGPLLEDETAAALFTYLVDESEDRQPGAAHQVATLTEPEALDYLLARHPLRSYENGALVTAIRLLNPERFGHV